MSNAKQYATRANKQKNEEDEDTDSNFSVNIPSTPDALTLLTQAMSSLLASVEDDKRSRRQAEAERKQEERERWEFEAKAEAERKQEERERQEFEAKAEAERKQEKRERREFEDACLRYWEQIEKNCHARLESLEGANAERGAAAIEAHTKKPLKCIENLQMGTQHTDVPGNTGGSRRSSNFNTPTVEKVGT